MKTNQKIYFGGSRNPQNINPSQIAAVVAAVVASGAGVHVGCQFGADQAVIKSASLLPRPHNAPSQFLRVFTVAPTLAESPAHIQWVNTRNVTITFSAGGHRGHDFSLVAGRDPEVVVAEDEAPWGC